jgi:hypothetical protein
MIRLHPLFLILLLLALAHTALGSPAPLLSPTKGDIAGVVRDNRGNAVPHARVRISAGPQLGEARTDRNGRYTLADLEPGSYQLFASKPAYATVARSGVAVQANQATTVNFALDWVNPAAGAVEAVVRDPSGEPLPDSSVELQRTGTFVNRIPTDAVGSAVFPGLPAGSYNLIVRRPGFFDFISRAFQVREGRLTTFNVVLRRDGNQVGRLGGTVRDVDLRPVGGAVVRIIAGLTRRQATTPAGGTFELAALIPAAGYSIQVSANGFNTQVISNITVNPQQSTLVNVVLVRNAPSRGSLTGVVRDNTGAAVQLATVTITAGPASAQGLQAVTGPDGRYLFQELEPADNYAVVAEIAGFAPEGRSRIAVRAGQTAVADLDLSLQQAPPGSLTGVVREAGSGALLAGVQVEIIEGPSAGLAGTTDGAGRYLFQRLVPDDAYALRFTKDGFDAFSQSSVDVRSGQQTVLDVQLTPRGLPTGTLRGTVRNPNRQTVAGARVVLFEGPSAPLETTTNNRGVYQFANIRAGAGYAVRASRTGFVDTEARGIAVGAGQTVVQNLTLSRRVTTGTIRGRVSDLGLLPVEGATVRVIQGPAAIEDARTGADGFFQMDAVPQGTYTLDFIANGFRTARRSGIIVSPDRTTFVNVQLLR